MLWIVFFDDAIGISYTPPIFAFVLLLAETSQETPVTPPKGQYPATANKGGQGEEFPPETHPQPLLL